MNPALFLLIPLLLPPAASDNGPVLKFNAKAKFDLPSIPAKDIAKVNAIPATAPAQGHGQAHVFRQINGIVMSGGPMFAGGNQASTDPSEPGPGEAPILRWNNGESLRGQIASSTSGELTWKAPLFQDPLELKWNALDRIEWPTLLVPPVGPFGVALRDGSFIYGDLVDVGANTITLRSARHGDAVLKRSEVLAVRRLHGGSLVYCGPTGDIGWKPLSIQQDGSVNQNSFGPDFAAPLAAGPGGALHIANWNRSGRLDITLPESIDVEFSVSSLKRPDFVLALGGNPRATVRLETWDDQLVLALGEDFLPVEKISDDARQVTLRICWDKQGQKCRVYSAAGQLIADWHVPRSIDSTAPGLLLENKGLDLSLDYIRVRQWKGNAPPKMDPGQPQLELADGRTLAGAIVAGAPGAVHLQVAGQPAATDFPLAQVDALQFSSDRPAVPEHEATLLYNDGSILFGHLDSIADGHASLTTSFTASPLSSQLDNIRRLIVRMPAPADAKPATPLANLDTIVMGERTLHGVLGSIGGNEIGWIPVGGVKPARPAPAPPSVITRYFPDDAPAPADPALFYLASGDVLPGTLGTLDRDGAEFSSSLMPARKIPAAELDAIKLSPSARLHVEGFKDPGWEILHGSDAKVHWDDDDTVRLDPGAALSFSSAMQCSVISFKFISNGLSAARFRMFCSKTEPSRGINLLLGSTGNQFIAGLESTQGQFDSQVQIKTNPGEPVNVRLEVGEDKVELFANDVSQLRIPIDPAKRGGSGLVIEPAGLWGNNSFGVSLSNFSARSGPGHTWIPDVSDDVRNQVLTVPRFQKDDPPRHLLVAGNGDVLRGEVIAATPSHFGFRSGLDELNVPRDRVSALIWLKPADPNAPEAAAASTPAPGDKPSAGLLDQRIAARIMFRQTGLTQLVSFLQSQAPGLTIKLPDNVPPRMVQMLFANQTVSEALDVICSRFDLHYHLAPDGTVILEGAGGGTTPDVVAKTYWLKPGAVPKTPTIQQILTAKGITFGADASVQWQPDSGMLSMVNTPDNQARLATLVGSDFGGSLGSPTHWLQLSSGARLALAVDQIGPDFITGHHPVYGAVKVPLADVFSIRTTPPPPSAAITALESWRLVNAPEPVVPEGSGVASPLLGKDAPGFKLPLAEAGDFNLEDEKGHVVVLDFWATWCGPCVKSLPGLVDAVAAFPADRVKLIGVNQGEAPAQVQHFLQTRGLKLTVAMDSDQAVGQKYGADAIPQTVIVGPDGKIAWVQTGASEDEDAAVADVIKKLLDPAAAANVTPEKSTQ